MGGGNPTATPIRKCASGLSPRGRGKRRAVVDSGKARGSIPAWAGETRPYQVYQGRGQVYPRVGGGNAPTLTICGVCPGLSPRGRGKRLRIVSLVVFLRSIPAWAGETRAGVHSKSERRVYPRVGGGNVVGAGPKKPSAGLSPRGRGKRSRRRPEKAVGGSIPAWAGETRYKTSTIDGRTVYPRVGGGNFAAADHIGVVEGLSPRGRGKRCLSLAAARCSGSIPAWAGETTFPSISAILGMVYPRVGGGNLVSIDLNPNVRGLSPRGRGKQAPSA